MLLNDLLIKTTFLKMNYKYCIKERMLALTVEEYKKIRKELPKAIGKTIRTFDRYCTLRADEFSDIPAQDLDIIASFLDCDANDLKNYSVSGTQIHHKVTRQR